MESRMSESYQKLRKDFKELDFTDRLTFLAESVLLTGQSAVSVIDNNKIIASS